VRLSVPSGDAGIQLAALVDTGADVSVMPLAAVQDLSLPVVATTRLAGVAGALDASLHAALVEVGGLSRLAEVVALGEEAILGRDLVNQLVLGLDGPRRLLEIRGTTRRARPR
jgi:predicted aspartyl protease